MKKINEILGKTPIKYSFLILCFLLGMAYVVFSIIKSANEVNQMEIVVNSLFIAIITITFVILGLLSKDKQVISTYALAFLFMMFFSYNILNKIDFIELPKQATVVDWTNKLSANILSWASENNITVNQTYEYSDTVPINHIISQSVQEGTLLKDVKIINTVISSGPNYDKVVIIPNMIGLSIDEVVKTVENNFLNNVSVKYEVNTDVKDTIITQSRYGEMKRNDEIKFTVSLGTDPLPKVAIITLNNQSLFNATLWLERNGLKYEISYDFSDKIAKNNVISQDKVNGTVLDPATDLVKLVVSKGKEIIVPDLYQMKMDELTNWIIDNNLKINFSERFDDTIAKGKVVEANFKNGDVISEGSLVTIVNSKGPLKMIKINNIGELRSFASNYGLTLSESYEFSTSVANGGIVKTSHAEGTIIANNETISVTISQGAPVTIPNFVGMTRSAAASKCSSVGLKCSFVEGTYGNVAKDVATNQDKRAGSTVINGTYVKITLSKGVASIFNLVINATCFNQGSYNGAVTCLKNDFNKYPNVNFTYQSGSTASQLPGTYIRSCSTVETGSKVKQGETYKICIQG